MKKIAVLGTQASGKGTQSHILSVIYGVPAVSVGDLLRDLQKEDSERGRLARERMSKGSFVADDIILPLLKDWVAKHPKGWVIDGFPRSVDQAEKSSAFFHPDAVIYLEIPDEESHRRISYRRVCVKCRTNYNLITQPPHNPQGVCDIDGGELVRREDDTPELVDQRLKAYHEITEPLKAWFDRRGLLLLVDGKPPINDVAREIQRQLTERFRKASRRSSLFVWLGIGLATLVAIFVLFTVTGFILEG